MDKVMEYLALARSKGRLPHALVFSGEDREAKLKVTLRLMASHLCQESFSQPQEMLSCCEQCANCKQVFARTHPHTHWIEGEKEEIRVEQIRELKSDSRFQAFGEGSQFWILPDADNLNNSASNAFLKTLEEPSKGRYFILLASSKSSLPSTVASRCLELFFPSPQQARELSPKENVLTEVLWGGNWEKAMNLVEPLAKKKEELTAILEEACRIFQKKLDDPDLQQRELAGNLSSACLSAIEELKKHLNTQLVLEKTFIHCLRLKESSQGRLKSSS